VSLPQITRVRNRLNHTPLCLLRRHLPRKGGDRVLRKRRLRVDRTRLTPQRFQWYSQNTRQSFPRAQTPCHHCRTPVTGWIVNVPVQAGGRPPGICRNVRRDDGGGGAPAGSAGSRISLNGRPSRDVLTGGSAKPATGEILAPCARPAPAGCQGEGGNGPVAGRLADAGRAWRLNALALAFPDHLRKAQPVPDDATRRSRLPVSGRRTSGTRPPVGCGHHPAIFGPARNLRHPACHRESGACTPNPLPNGTACARPSGLSFQKLRRRCARRIFVRRSEAEPDHPFRGYSLS
jgi:hypothetical protein